MLSRFEEAQQKWGGSHSVIDAWLTERQELLLQFCKLAGFAPFEKKIMHCLTKCRSKVFVRS